MFALANAASAVVLDTFALEKAACADTWIVFDQAYEASAVVFATLALSN
jgi:hypothetical protein